MDIPIALHIMIKFSQAKTIIACPRTIICNNCETNLLCDILNAADNIDDQEDYGFRRSFLKISTTVIDDCLKKTFLNMKLEHLGPQRNKENNDKEYNGR